MNNLPSAASPAQSGFSPVSASGSGPGASGLCRLTDWGLIRAQGEEAAKFLHGQLTQDIEHLPLGQARLAGYCSAKGRLLATLVVWRTSADELLLACSADLLPTTLKRLQMFVLRAKCKLTDASAERPLWGVVGPAALSLPGSAQPLAVWCVAASDAATLVRLPDAQGPRSLLLGAPPSDLLPMDEDHWRWLEVHSGVARVVAATQDCFVPQMVNLELVGGVNFKKGCYPGQEVVARSQYRGTLKRRAYVLHAPVALQPGQEVFSSLDPEQPAGRVALVGTSASGEHAALVELKMAALLAGSLHAGSASGPELQAGAQPYEIPVGEAV